MMDWDQRSVNLKILFVENVPSMKTALHFLPKKFQIIRKTKKVKAEDLALTYYFVHRNGKFLIRQREMTLSGKTI
jgi:A/G-specific adenine glycosylase